MPQLLCVLLFMPFMFQCGKKGKEIDKPKDDKPIEESYPMPDYLRERPESHFKCSESYKKGIEEYGYEEDHLPFLKGVVVVKQDGSLVLAFRSEVPPTCTLDVYTSSECDYIKSDGKCEVL